MEKRLRRQCLAPEVVVRIESDLISQHPTSSTCLLTLWWRGVNAAKFGTIALTTRV